MTHSDGTQGLGADGKAEGAGVEARAAAAAPAPAAESASDGLMHPRIEDARPEIEHPAGSARIPGIPNHEYSRLPTGPVGVGPLVTSGPETGPVPEWEPSTGAIPVEDDSRLAPWALLAAIVALITSFFVGWGLPVAIVAVIAAIMSLRRPLESRSIARWSLVLGILATVYSLGWLIWAATQLEAAG